MKIRADILRKFKTKTGVRYNEVFFGFFFGISTIRYHRIMPEESVIAEPNRLCPDLSYLG